VKENNSKKEQRNGKIHLNFEMGFKYISRKITLKYLDQWSFPSSVGYEVHKIKELGWGKKMVRE